MLLLLALPGFAATPAEQDGGVSTSPYEWKVFPMLAGNSDIGFEFGVLGLVNKLGSRGPYEWSLMAQVALSVKGLPGGGGAEFPVHEDFVRFDWRDPGGRWRVATSLSFWQAANAGFFGLGNLSPPNGMSEASGIRATQYRRSQLVASGFLAYEARPCLRVRLGFLGRRVAPQAYPGSTLALERESEPLLLGVFTHGSIIGVLGVEWDTRDQELTPTRGAWLEASLRGSPGPVTGIDLSFGGVTVHLRGFHEFIENRLVVAGRILFDGVFGRPPLQELSHSGGFTDVWMLGGTDGARGIPEGRYQGRLRLIASLEARLFIAPFVLLGRNFRLGVVAFTDTGRVWADWTPRPDLDGTGLGLHLAFGAGLRVQWGKTVLIRFDVAYAPPPASTAINPIGIYFILGESF